MKFVLETTNPFHTGWLTAHLGQPPKSPTGLNDVELSRFKHGYRTYQESLRGTPMSARMAMSLEEFIEHGNITIERHEIQPRSDSDSPVSPIP